MGLFGRRDKKRTENTTQKSPQSTENPHVWLPGGVEVPVAGESFHADAIRAVEWGSPPGSSLAAVLVPQPDNPHDVRAVAVYLNGKHVGFLPRDVARRVQPTLVSFSRAHAGRLVSCPAEIREHDVGPQVLLLLNPEPLGVPPRAFQLVPDLDATMGHLLSRLDEPAPPCIGINSQARTALAEVEKDRAYVDADYDRSPEAWPRVERAFRHLADELAAVDDPFASEAWLGVGRATRYQRGRRDDTLRAFTEALYWRRSNIDAWCDLVDMTCAAPHVATLLALFAQIPFDTRPGVLPQYLSVSYGRDRLGRMSLRAGELLRAGLLELAESQGDLGSIAFLSAEEGLAAEKVGDLEAAVGWWRRAIAAGSTHEKVADKLSVWLTKRHEYVEAEQVLRQALVVEPHSAEAAERMRRRLARCERNLAE